MRLVLRVLDWYTSCSSLNLPSAEYAGNARKWCNPSLAGSIEFQSFTDRRRTAQWDVESRRPSEQHHLSHQQIRVKLRLCSFEQLAPHRSRSGRHQASRRFAKPEGGCRRAHRL